jgi:hypothetical protein
MAGVAGLMPTPEETFKLRLDDVHKRREQLALAAEDLIKRLRYWTRHESQRAVAGKLGVRPQFLQDMLKGRRLVGKAFVTRVHARLAERAKESTSGR